VFDEFFSKTRCHEELVSRSEGLLTLLLSENILGFEDFDLIWSSISSNGARTNEFYKVLKELATKLNSD
jgi:hypothetical protein